LRISAEFFSGIFEVSNRKIPKMRKSIRCLTSLSILTSSLAFGQYVPPDCGAVEEITLERYYVADSNDAGDSDGGELEEGAVTWRVYVDLKPGYVLETVFGSDENELRIETTTEFFNNEDRGESFGDALPANRLGDNTVALDSYLTMGAASDEHLAVLKDEDPDGQIVAGDENDGGSEGVEEGLLVNEAGEIGAPLTQADGLIEGSIISAGSGEIASITSIGFDASIFGDENSSEPFVLTDGAWAVLGGIVGPTADNRILIAQLTTTGDVTLELNLRVGIPDELQCNTSNCHENMDFVFQKSAGQLVASIPNDRICSLPEPMVLSIENETFAQEGFQIYPNPSEKQITIALSPNRANQSSYRIFDIYGRQVQASGASSLVNGILTLDIADLPVGTYLIQMENEGETATERFVKL